MNSDLAIQLCVVVVLIQTNAITPRQLAEFACQGFTRPAEAVSQATRDEVPLVCNAIASTLSATPHAVNVAEVVRHIQNHTMDGRLTANDVIDFIQRTRRSHRRG